MCFSQYVSGKIIPDSSKEVKLCHFRKRKRPLYGFCYIVILSMTLMLYKKKKKSEHAGLHQLVFWSVFTQSTCLYGSFRSGGQLFLSWDTLSLSLQAASLSSLQRGPSAAGDPTVKWESSPGEKFAFQQLRRALHTDHEDIKFVSSIY